MSNIRDRQNGPRREGSLKSVECTLLEGSPGPWLVLPGKEVEWSNNMEKVGDKFVIEVCKPEERTNTLDRGRRFPFLDGGKFDGVHFNLPMANNHTKEFNVWDIKGTFGKFKGQPMFMK